MQRRTAAPFVKTSVVSDSGADAAVGSAAETARGKGRNKPRAPEYGTECSPLDREV